MSQETSIEFYDSGRYAVAYPPMPDFRSIGPFPKPLPARIRFSVAKSEPPASASIHTKLMHDKAVRLCMLHFGEMHWTYADGTLHRWRRIPKLLEQEEPVELLIDLQFGVALMCALELPENNLHIRELRLRQHPAEQWRICLSRRDDPGWHDHIVFKKHHRGSGVFCLESILQKNADA